MNVDRRVTRHAFTLGLAVFIPFLASVWLGGCSAGEGPSPPIAVEGGSDSESADASADASGGEGGDMCSPDGFCRTLLPGVPPPSLVGLFTVSKTRTVASTTNGDILLWDGTAWHTIAFGYTGLQGVWASDPDHFWITQSSAAILEVTFDDAGQFSVSSEALPDAAGCATSVTISGTGESDIYLAVYCSVITIDEVEYSLLTGSLFHRGPDTGTGSRWSLLWSGGDQVVEQVALGGVFAVAPGEAWAVGWKCNPRDTVVGPTYTVPGYSIVDQSQTDPSNLGTRTFVLHVKDGAIDEEELPVSLAMCAQSVWSSGATNSLFVGGACTFFNLSNDDYQDPSLLSPVSTVIHRVKNEDGGVSWAPIIQLPGSVLVNGATRVDESLTRNPSKVWGFSDADVYLAGQFAQHWDGSGLALVELAIHGAPFATNIVVLQGTSPDNLWIAGETSVLHRGR